MISIDSIWQDFARTALKAVPKNSNQYIQCKRVFYCGASQGLLIIHKITSPDVTEEQAADVLDRVLKEVHHFLQGEVETWEKN